MSADNKGNLWTAEEVEQLKQEFNNGLLLEDIVEAHGRTPYGIMSKLQAMGVVYQIGRDYHRVNPEPWAMYSSIVALQRKVLTK